MSNCDHIQDLLVSYIFDELSESDKRMVQEHLGSCSVCSQELQNLEDARIGMQALQVPEPAGHIEMRLKQAARLALDEKKVTWGGKLTKLFGPTLLGPVFSAAAVTLIAGVTLYMHRNDLDPGPNPATGAAYKTEADGAKTDREQDTATPPSVESQTEAKESPSAIPISPAQKRPRSQRRSKRATSSLTQQGTKPRAESFSAEQADQAMPFAEMRGAAAEPAGESLAAEREAPAAQASKASARAPEASSAGAESAMDTAQEDKVADAAQELVAEGSRLARARKCQQALGYFAKALRNASPKTRKQIRAAITPCLPLSDVQRRNYPSLAALTD
ncbi:MAG: zf-HC2 domain-containing protein [Myxococcales bacterium]|nr:MAG: zf-HC2 domain-containing protein [Myxococcales bacterium]